MRKARFLLLPLLAAAAVMTTEQMNYKFPGTGAVARRLTSRLSDSVSVKDFGAVGNGTVDDTANIQAAATAAAGKTLRFSPGTYKLTNKITISSGTKLLADGAVTLNQTVVGHVVFYCSGCSNVEVRGFTMTAADSSAVPIEGPSDQECGAVCFDTSGSNILIHRNVITGFFNGISAVNVVGLTVRDNEVSHWRIYGILASQSVDFSLDHNRMHDNDMPAGTAWSAVTTYARGQTATGSADIWMSLQNGNLNHAIPATPPGDAFWLRVATYGLMATGNRGTVSQLRSSITHNIVYNNPLWDGIMSHDTDGLEISQNDFRNVRIGIDMGGAGAGKYDEKLVITGNYLEDTTTDMWGGLAARNCGILLFGSDASTKARNATIVGNVITGFNRFNSGISASGSICLSNTDGVVVTGNQLTGVQAFAGNAAGGIIANAITNGLTISGNSVDVAAGLPSVFLTNVTSGDQISVVGNTLRDANTTGNGLKITGSTIASLVATGNSTNAAVPYSVATSTITKEYTDLLTRGGANKLTRSYVTSQGGTGCVGTTSTALGGGLTNIDIVTADLSADPNATVNVVLVVTAQQPGNTADTDTYRFKSAAKGGRNAGANAVWVPAAATNMVRGDTDFASAGVAVATPKLIWNASTNTATLQFQPQLGPASYHLTYTATSWRGTATCL